MKAKRVTREDGRNDYRIYSDRGVFYAMGLPNGEFRCGDLVGTLKFIKKMILSGQARPGAIDDTADYIAEDGDHIAEDDSDRGTWKCMHPCALLVMIVGSEAAHPQQADVLHTLDSYGWLTPEGTPDYRRALAEKQRHSVHNKKQKEIAG